VLRETEREVGRTRHRQKEPPRDWILPTSSRVAVKAGRIWLQGRDQWRALALAAWNLRVPPQDSQFPGQSVSLVLLFSSSRPEVWRTRLYFSAQFGNGAERRDWRVREVTFLPEHTASPAGLPSGVCCCGGLSREQLLRYVVSSHAPWKCLSTWKQA
jgi:hypothetical protein